MKKLLRVFLAVCLLTAPILHAQSVTTYYVATSGGSDSNTCTQAQTLATAKATVEAGMGCLVEGDGDILEIRTGTYNEQLIDLIPSGFSIAYPTIIRNYGTETVIIRPSGSCAEGRVIGFGGKEFITFLGNGTAYTPGTGGTYTFQLDANNLCSAALGTNDNNSASNYITIDGLLIEDSVRSTVFIGGEQALVTRSLIRNSGVGSPTPDLDHCLYSDFSDSVVEDVSFSNCSGYGSQIQDQLSPIAANDNIYQRIWCKGNGSACLLISGQGSSSNHTRNIFRNVISINDADVPADAWGGIRVLASRGNTIIGNTIYNAGGLGGIVMYDATTDDNVVCNNVIWESNGSNLVYEDTGAVNLGCGALSVVNSNRSTDPAFVNVSTDNFHLNGSLNDGATHADLTEDFDEVLRGSPPDRGAYEFGGGGAAPPKGGTLTMSGGGVF